MMARIPRCISGLILPFLAACAHASSASDPVEWYGNRLGEKLSPGAHERVRDVPDGIALVAASPWSSGMGTTDRNGNLTDMTFLVNCYDFMDDAPPSYTPKRLHTRQEMRSNGEVAEAYALSRLGPPSGKRDSVRDGDPARDLEWDFTTKDLGCDGARPIIRAAAHERSGRIAFASFRRDDDQIVVTIVGRNSNALEEPGGRDVSPADQRAAAKSCAQQQYDKQHPLDSREINDEISKKYEVMPGLFVVPALGVKIVPSPMAKKAKPALATPTRK